MKYLPRTLIAAALLPMALAAQAADPLPRAKPESVGLSAKRLDHLAEVLRAEVARGQLPGAVVAIARKGKLAYYESFGYLDPVAKTPMPKDAIFAIASMTKPMATVGALMLYEDNQMLMNDPVGKYLPVLDNMPVAVVSKDGDGKDAMTTVPAQRKPTIQDLMRHTAGFTYGNRGKTELYKSYPQSSNNSAETLTGQEFLAKLGGLPLHYQPGMKWDYSLSFDVLGLAIEAVSGKPLGAYLGDTLFKPLGMRDTAFVVPAEKVGRFAKPLPNDPVSGRPVRMRDATIAPKFDCGGGCVVSTAADYLRFGQMLLNHGQLDGVRILGRKTVDYMVADHMTPEIDGDQLRKYYNINSYGFGLGVAVRKNVGGPAVMGTPGDYHWSGANGTNFWVDPKEELVVVFMAHTPGAMRFHYRQVINQLVLQALK